MLLDNILDILKDPPVRRGTNLKQVVDAAKAGADIKVVPFTAPLKNRLKKNNFCISYTDQTGAHILIPFHWNSSSEALTLTKAILHISTRQK